MPIGIISCLICVDHYAEVGALSGVCKFELSRVPFFFCDCSMCT